MSRSLVVCGLVALVLASSAKADEVINGQFSLSAFGESAVQPQDIRKGLEFLFAGTKNCEKAATCPTGEKLNQAVAKTLAFQNNLRTVVESQRRTQPTISYTDTIETTGTGGWIDKHTFQFPSLVQRPGNHPSNMVVGTYLVPHRFKACPHRYPTIVLVHSSAERVDERELRLADALVSTSKNVGVMMIYLPHYGPRRARQGNVLANGNMFDSKELNSDYLSSDPETLKFNMGQSLLDLHAAIDWLKSLRSVDSSRLAMLGLSMGGILQPLFEGMNPGKIAAGHVNYAGGGDLAAIMEHYHLAYKDDPLTLLWQRAGWDGVWAREHLFEVDPITWGARVQNQKIYMIAAERDELMWRKENVEKLSSSFAPGNSIQWRWNDTDHSATGASDMYLLANVVTPISSFVVRGEKGPTLDQCN